MARQLKVVSGHAAGCQETKTGQGSREGSGSGQADPGHQKVQAGRLHHYWAKGSGSDLSYAVYKPNSVFFQGGQVGQTARNLIEASWRSTTEEQYGGCWSRWTEYCESRGICTASPNLSQVLDYLAHLFEKGLAYSTINTYRSALSQTLPSIEGFNIGSHPLVTRLMKGVFNKRRPTQTLVPKWSVERVLEMLRLWHPPEELDLDKLTRKTVMLLALATARRCSSLAILSTKQGYFVIGEENMSFQPLGLEKQSRPDHVSPPIEVRAFEDQRVDPVKYTKAYIERTQDLRQTQQLLLSLRPPHKAASKAVIARWLEQVIAESGQKGTGGSVRSAATSKAISAGISTEMVLKAGDWSRESTFRRFYFKPVPLSFSDAVLS